MFLRITFWLQEIEWIRGTQTAEITLDDWSDEREVLHRQGLGRVHSEKTLTRSPRTAARQSTRVTRVQFHQKLVELARHCLTNDCFLVASPLFKGFHGFSTYACFKIKARQPVAISWEWPRAEMKLGKLVCVKQLKGSWFQLKPVQRSRSLAAKVEHRLSPHCSAQGSSAESEHRLHWSGLKCRWSIVKWS